MLFRSGAVGTAGTTNTGGGGGGGGAGPAVDGNGGAGGSGVVVIRTYGTGANAYSTTGSPAFSSNGRYSVYTFTASGTIMWQ